MAIETKAYGISKFVRKRILRVLLYTVLTYGGGELLAEDIPKVEDDVLPPIHEGLSHLRYTEGGSVGTDSGEDGGEAAEGVSENGDGADASLPGNNVDSSDYSSGSSSNGSTSGLVDDSRDEHQAEVTEPVPETITFEATAYTAYCEGCSGITYSGVDVRNTIYHEGRRIVAVDPAVIPLGTVVEITYANGHSFEAVAEDIGSAIKGRRIDILVNTKEEAFTFGRQDVEVRIITEGER